MKCTRLHQTLPSGISRGKPLRICGHPVRRFFSNHEGGAVGVATGNAWHDARINHPQAANAANLQVAVDHRHGVVFAAHARGANRVKNGAGNVTCQLGQFFIRLLLNAWLEFFGFKGGHGGL